MFTYKLIYLTISFLKQFGAFTWRSKRKVTNKYKTKKCNFGKLGPILVICLHAAFVHANYMLL